jgi:hypothetical protein
VESGVLYAVLAIATWPKNRTVWRGVFYAVLPRPYNEEQLRLLKSLETNVRIVGVWCEMAASLGFSGVEWSELVVEFS